MAVREYSAINNQNALVKASAIETAFASAVTVAAKKLLLIRALSYTVTTNAEAGNRFLGYEILDADSNVLAQIFSPAVSTISQTYQLTALAGSPVAPTVGNESFKVFVPLPEMWLPAGFQVKTLTSGLKAGDTKSTNFIIYVEEQGSL